MNYRDRVAERAPEDAKVIKGDPGPCLKCGTMTPHAVLCMLGAQCTPCFEAYKRERPQQPRYDAKTGPMAWALALKERELSGERLTTPQKEMWRSALGEMA